MDCIMLSYKEFLAQLNIIDCEIAKLMYSLYIYELKGNHSTKE